MHVAKALARGQQQLALGSSILLHLFKCMHDIAAEGMKPHQNGPLWIFQWWLQLTFLPFDRLVYLTQLKPTGRPAT